ncbi:hypothetical protein EDD80_11522 [Anseongella ginsenosidimutans]|uniref:Uncharacterized protein n=1 Tax=Anseongella ginsenosidimutans TaxID=496056 RepID=A0A4R3KLM5_9SPHI|nr:hypothetical protein [Anseongella ginsenosidimutans]QEC51930.1 hypothetical protein FRZ59_06010 [Anseongella ginsenosidimutans]TCS85039.1 hypothetical protein EDD80_11522 [Anseongella ginsenosidimutans]
MITLKFLPFACTALLIVLFQGCKKEDETLLLSNELELQFFSIKTPAGWNVVEEQGYDSYVGYITDGEKTIHFDQGTYVSDAGNISEDENTIYLERLTIQGDPAVIHKEKAENGTILSAYIQGKGKTRLYVRNPANDEFYKAIFKTHSFN